MSEPAGYRIDKTFTMPVASEPPTQPAMPPTSPKRDLVDLVRRIAVTEVRAGDTLVFEMTQPLNDYELDEMAQTVRQALGDNTLSLIVNGTFSGVLRPEAVDVKAVAEAVREAARPWQGHTYDKALPYMVAAAVRAVIEGGRQR
jgi:hypothetical protein